jgi:hypothetical protein
MCDPEITIAIFSVVKPIAQAFLNQIKEEFEQNEVLKKAFNDVLYANPRQLGTARPCALSCPHLFRAFGKPPYEPQRRSVLAFAREGVTATAARNNAPAGRLCGSTVSVISRHYRIATIMAASLQ